MTEITSVSVLNFSSVPGSDKEHLPGACRDLALNLLPWDCLVHDLRVLGSAGLGSANALMPPSNGAELCSEAFLLCEGESVSWKVHVHVGVGFSFKNCER